VDKDPFAVGTHAAHFPGLSIAKDISNENVLDELLEPLRGRRIDLLAGPHAAGLRYRLHVSGLPGRPDIVLPRYHAVLLIHGCFWHGHDCVLFKMPPTRREFWAKKIAGNRARDKRSAAALKRAGWRVLTVWECSLKGPGRRPLADIMNACVAFIKGNASEADISGVRSTDT